jgi:Holliday junction resolvasome RuvABC endonuclease subunit
MILGLDISTSITGFTVLTEDGHILHNEAIRLDSKKLETMFQKAQVVKNRLQEIKDLYNIKDVYIEQSLNAFRPGLSSAQVILTLGKFNGIVSWICCELFGKEPNYIGASSARKKLDIKIEKGANAKEIVLKHVLALEPTFKVEYTKHGNPVAGTYDRADSYVIAKAGYILCQNQKN